MLEDGSIEFGEIVVLLVGHTVVNNEGWQRVPVGAEVEHRCVNSRPSGLSNLEYRKSRSMIVTGFDRPMNVYSHFMGILGTNLGESVRR
jgi:hypothetical protein